MMTNNTNEIKKVTGYKIDFESNTIYMNYKFAAAADSYGSQEYRIMTMILKDFPDMRRVVQAGRKVTSAHKNKRLTYENMEKHIKAYENSQTLLDSYIIRWTSVLSNRFDTTGFKKVYGDLYKAFTKQSSSRRFTISA